MHSTICPNCLDHTMDAELRVAIDGNADVGRHNLGLKQYAIRFSILHVAPALPVGGPLGRGRARRRNRWRRRLLAGSRGGKFWQAHVRRAAMRWRPQRPCAPRYPSDVALGKASRIWGYLIRVRSSPPQIPSQQPSILMLAEPVSIRFPE
jgi:hypothetical protein